MQTRFFLLPIIALVILLVSAAANAEPDPSSAAGVLRFETTEPLDAVYDRLYKALEAEKFWVVFEPDMGKRMAKMADKWGDDYNRSELGAVKSMVFCNLWWTNRIANADPNLLALCPLHLSIFEQAGKTVVVTPRLSAMAEGSSGHEKAAELETVLTELIRDTLLAQPGK